MSFYVAKIFWLIINPFNILIILSLSTFLAYFLDFKKIKLISIFFLSISFIIFCILPTGNYLIYQLEKNFHDYADLSKIKKIDGIIIMGGSTNPYLSKIYNQTMFLSSAERMIEAKRVINKFPNAKIIFTGGSSKMINNKYKESSDAKKFFLQNKIDINNIIFEDNARNTFENILKSEKISNRNENEKWLIISSAYHLTRSINVAKKIGWNLQPYATDFQVPKKFRFYVSIDFFSNLASMQLATHEWIGILYYFFTGRTERIL